jgi:uncharacterized protein
MDRRRFLTLAAAGAGAALFGADFWRSQYTLSALRAGSGPYGEPRSADSNGIELPEGFTSRVVAHSGQPVAGTEHRWHRNPDGGACFQFPSGGWVYVSNSEVGGGGGGASAVRFDGGGRIVDAFTVLTGTSRNCAGGATPWGTWLSCEENGAGGRVWECDPLRAGQGNRREALGAFAHEAAAVHAASGRVYLTEDDPKGRLYRFTPDTPGDLSAGQLEAARVEDGFVTWMPTSHERPDRQGGTSRFNGGEGAWIHAGMLFFTTKGDNRVWELNLATGAIGVLYEAVANDGPLKGVDNITAHSATGDLFVCEDGGNMEICVIPSAADTREVAPFLRVAGQSGSELTGVAFSPGGTRMYLSSQRGTDDSGITYEIAGPFRTVPGPARRTLISRGATWKYLDDGSDQRTSWRDPTFDDSDWRSGTAPLGYGDRVTTRVSYGPDADRKHVTTYFRHRFEARRNHTELHLRVRRDDGVVIYINGTEVTRSNMPSGRIGYDTLAARVFTGSSETMYYTIPIRAAVVRGTNVIAAEVHQGERLSSDLVFDLELTG